MRYWVYESCLVELWVTGRHTVKTRHSYFLPQVVIEWITCLYFTFWLNRIVVKVCELKVFHLLSSETPLFFLFCICQKELIVQSNVLMVKYIMTSYLNWARLFLSNPSNNPLISVKTTYSLHCACGVGMGDSTMIQLIM